MNILVVNYLYLNSMSTSTILFVGIFMLLTFLVLTHRNESYMILANAYRNGLLFLGSLLLFVGIYAIVDFNGFWMNFHYIFFDNDLFLLDPNVSIMINMFPSNFFFAVVFGIIVLFISMIVLLKILLVLLKQRI